MRILFLFILIICTSCGQKLSGKAAPKLVKGVLDLKNWDFKKDGPIELKGDWRFDWNKFVDPLKAVDIPHFEKVPGRWINYKNKYPKLGFATYSVTLKNPPKNSDLIFNLKRISSSFKFFIVQNGAINKGKNGVLKKSKEGSIPGKRLLLKNYHSSSGDITLVFHLSNYFYRSGGFFVAPTLGLEQMMREASFQQQSLKILISGILLMMALYHFALYLLRRSDKAGLAFSVFCTLLMLRGFATEGSLEYFFDMSAGFYTFQKKIEFISMAWSCASFLFFVRSILGPKFGLRIYQLSVLMGVVFSLFTLFTPPDIFSHNLGLKAMRALLVFIGVTILIELGLATKRKEDYASIIFYPFIFALFTGIYEVVAANYDLNYKHLSSFGFTIFVFAQSYILAKKFNNAYLTSERLTGHLQEEVDKQTKSAVDSMNKFKNIIDNINQAVFVVDEDGKIYHPASAFSKVIFEEEIESKDIYETVFRNMDSSSEEFGGIQFGMSCVYEQEVLQWQILKDQFPSKIWYVSKNGHKKRLHISYNPLFEEDLLTKIMFVVEDITELER